jgi:ATP/maltotriose-dependent transcriptional regulator MalT
MLEQAAARSGHGRDSVLYNGLGRYQEGVSAARHATSNTFEPWVSMWGLPELVEAAARVGDTELARDALTRLEETTQSTGVDVAHGIEARSRALLTNGDNADLLYREAIERLGRTQVRPELARRKLLATGEQVRKRSPETREELTAQETQIARLARDGLSNPEIGAQLFISARTVEWHLRKVFTKLDISSRRQLRVALPEGGRALAP